MTVEVVIKIESLEETKQFMLILKCVKSLAVCQAFSFLTT